jgi:hypothetical protein
MRKIFSAFLLCSLFSFNAHAEDKAAPFITHGYDPYHPTPIEHIDPISSQPAKAAPAYENSEYRFQRWGVAPFIGGAHMLTRVGGHDMLPAFSFGVRSTFGITEWFGAGLQVNLDFIHFSTDDNVDQGRLEVSSATPLFVADFRIPNTGLFFGPVFGVSYKYYAHRDAGGFLSYRDAKGTDNLLVFGWVTGWYFKVGNHFSLGPRFDFYRYNATHTKFVGPHSALNFYFTTLFSF